MVTHSKVLYLNRTDGGRTSPDDESLIAACGQGDRAALGSIFDRHHQSVHRFISRLAGADADDVDDLLQNTFIEVARSAHQYSGRATVRNWIFGIAANVVKGHVRKGARHRRVLTAFKTVPPPAGPSPLHTVARKETLEKLADAVNRLPYKLKLPFVMYEIEGVPGVQIAAALGLRQGTVWRRLHDARKVLIAAMGREES